MASFNSYFDITRGYVCLFQGDDASQVPKVKSDGSAGKTLELRSFERPNFPTGSRGVRGMQVIYVCYIW